MAATWATFAAILAAHFFSLVNRADVHGRYKPMWSRRPDPRTGKVVPSYTAESRLTLAMLVGHCIGRCRGDLVGLHVSSPAETCKFVVVDIDAHGPGDDPAANWGMALAIYIEARGIGLDVLLLDSNGRGGFHLWIVFASPILMADAWRFGKWLVRDYAAFGLSQAPETFPKSPRLAGKKIGNWVRLPGRHHTRDHWTKAWDGERWREGAPAIRTILAVTGRDVDLGAVVPRDFEPPRRRVARRRSDIALPPTPKSAERRVVAARSALEFLGDGYRDDYDAWLRVGMALRQLGGPGLALWHEWSGPSDKYRPDVLDEKWAGFASDDEGPERGQITLGSLFYWASNEGWPGPTDPSPGRRVLGTFATPIRPLDRGGEVAR